MGKASRDKGNAAERELLKLLSDELGVSVQRNLSQTRGGGADCIEIAGWAVECKRQEVLKLNEWWQQTLVQSKKGNRKPILFYRKSRQPWQAVMLLGDITRDYELSHETVTMTLPAAAMIIREGL